MDKKIDKKKWMVRYDHEDGRSGQVEVTTEIAKSDSRYGNGKSGLLTVGSLSQGYDLRYDSSSDLHLLMLESYFGDGLVRATEM